MNDHPRPPRLAVKSDRWHGERVLMPTLPPATTALTESGHRRYTCPAHLTRFVGSVTAYVPGEGEQVTLRYACGCSFVRQISRARARTT